MVKYLIMDVDGSLTDGKVYMGNEGELLKAFSIKDGYASNYILKPAGIESVVITGRTSSIVRNRCKELGIAKVYQGVIDKLPKLQEAIGEDGLDACAYFGDDILDLRCMSLIRKAGGLVGCPADAVLEVKMAADYICIHKAGEGALREFAEWLAASPIDKNMLKNKVAEAVDYIRKLDKGNLEPGIYPVNKGFYYSVQEYETREEKDCVVESHRKYVDIQWIVEGEEAIDTADVAGLCQEKEYSEEKDVMFWKAKADMMRLVLKAGAYAIFYPGNAHRGCIAVNESIKVKKIVGKVSSVC